MRRDSLVCSQTSGTKSSFFPGAGSAYAFTLKATAAIYVAGDVYANYWRTATAEEKDGVIRQVTNVLYNVSGDFFVNVKGTVEDAAKPFMAKLEDAYARGDDAQVWNLWGQVGGSLVSQAITYVFMEVLGAQIAKAGPQLEAVAAKAAEEWLAAEEALPATASPLATLTTVPAGADLTLPMAERLWGQDAVADAEFIRISEKYKVLIGVRGRAPEAIQKLQRGSVWKHENLKPKNVNPIDVQYLGFNEADLAEVRFRTYTDQQIATISENIRNSNLTAEQKAAVFDRLETRSGEAKFVKPIEGYAKRSEINVGFNYRDNGINKTTTLQVRKFDLLSTPIEGQSSAGGHIPAGGTYYAP